MPRNIGLPPATDNSRDRDRGAIVAVPMRSSLRSPTSRVPCMIRRFWILSLAISASLGLAVGPATAQQSGGILKFFHRDSPASMSIHEEATISTVAPMMGVFNNLVLFKQDERQNRPEFIQPELAESWSWDEGNTRLTFKLRQGVKW